MRKGDTVRDEERARLSLDVGLPLAEALLTLIEDDDLARDLRGLIQDYSRQRRMRLPAKVLDAVVGLQGKREGTRTSLPVKAITAATNILLDADDESEKGENRITPRKIGSILRRTLHLATERAGQGRAYHMLWDQERIDALRRRFGMDDDRLQRTVQVLREHLGEEQSDI